MYNNPFVSSTFVNTWLKHFNNSNKGFSFEFIKDVDFIKHNHLPFYVNIGENITNGIFYSFVDLKITGDYKSRCLLIHDVPEYFNVNTNTQNTSLKVYKINQYKGYLADLKSYETFEEFFNSQFRSKRRNYLKKKQQQLELCFNIDYKFYFGDIPMNEYKACMSVFKTLISKRFGELGIANSVVDEWDYYYDLIYKMILDKRAMLFVIERDNNPIGIAFSFVSDDILFYATPTFDTDYIKFNLGHTTIMEIMKWCFENNIKYFDFSKGEFEYKKRWTNQEYHFQTHVLFDSKSIKSSLMGLYLTKYFKFKQFLRDKKVNLLLSKIKHKIKNSGTKGKKHNLFKVEELTEELNLNLFKKLDGYKGIKPNIEPIIINGLAHKPEPIYSLMVYQNIEKPNEYVVVGKKNKYSLIFRK